MMMNINRLKKCSRCRSEIMIKYFGLDRKGQQYVNCNDCRGTLREKAKEYYNNNKERLRIQNREYYNNNKERLKAIHKANGARYYRNNLEKHKNAVRRYSQEKWWVIIIGGSKYKDNNKGMDTATDYIDKEHLLYQREDQDNKCYYCLKIMVSSNRCDDDYQSHADDRLSIERMDNTLPHCKENVVFACLKCNKQRGDRHGFYEFYNMKLEDRLNRE